MCETKISVIIPVYNTENYLWECLESIYLQTQGDIEVIAVNDGSTDNSLQVLEEIKGKYPSLQIISQENKRQGAARNVGIRLAQGKYVYFMDSDDTLDKTALEDLYQISEKYELDLLCFNGRITGDVDRYNKEQYNYSSKSTPINCVINGRDYVKRNYKAVSFISNCMMLLNKSFLMKNDLLFKENVYFEDDEFYARLMSSNPKMMVTDKTYYNRRYREGSTMTSPDNKYKLKCRILVSRWIIDIEDDELGDIYKEQTIKIIKYIVDDKWKFIKKETEIHVMLEEILSKMLSEKIAKRIDISYILYLIALRLFPEKVELTRNNILEKITNLVSKVGFYDQSQLIGIYGTGNVCGNFLDIVENLMGKSIFNVIFLDTYVQSNEKEFRGCKVININDIASYPITSILVASSKYETAILEQLFTQDIENVQIFGLIKDFRYC